MTGAAVCSTVCPLVCPPPSPTFPSREGNLADIASAGSLHEFLLKLHQDHGPIAAFWWGATYTVSICTHDYFKQQRTAADRPLDLYGLYRPLFGDKSCLYENGEAGLQRRRAYDVAFSHAACGRYLKHFQKLANRLVEGWGEVPAGEQIPVCEHTSSYALRATLLALHGEDMNDDATVNDFMRGYRVIWDEMELLLTEPLTDERAKELEKGKARIRAITDTIVERRKQNPPSEDDRHFIDIVINYSPDAEQQFCDALGYVIAGFHTTGNMLAFAIYYMCKNPEVQEKVHEEIVQVLGDDDVTIDNIPYLMYTHQVLQETLRCAVVAPWAARVRDVPFILGDYVIPKHAPVIHALGVASKNADVFPEPDKFDPERFSPKNSESRPPLSFIPFGFAGKRKCPAEKFAYGEAAIFLVAVCRKFRLALVNDQDIQQVHGFVTHPSDEIWVTLTKR
ncbi:CP20A-like protein [Mya arenaria]|uniref:CP20A-like protein n=1 Tax=Mya arenaria TaxID=6604 RepID=A0ABY7DSL9_MYAAR|nr:CP20A-like protein [Mya arenaria]